MSEQQEQPNSSPTTDQPLLSLQGIGKAFGKQVIYDGLDLSVYRGETLCIIGPSGVGKSVMLKMMIGLLDPDAGKIFFDGHELTAFQRDEDFLPIRRRVAMVFQGAALFDSMSVFDNIAYPLREQRTVAEEQIADIVAEKLAWVGLPGIEQKKPAELSGGMRKRVGLARAIATDPEVILYDEPTTGLDPINIRRINDLIESLRERLHCTSIVVTHEMSTVFQVSDRVAFVYNRRIAESGTADALRRSKNPIIRGFIEGNPAQFGD